MTPDYIPPIIGLPVALVLTIIFIVLVVRERRTR